METESKRMGGLPARTDVVIVGAGPTGLALAISLQQAGVDYVLIDKLPEAQDTSRAGVIHAHTLEMLDRLGVAEALVEHGAEDCEVYGAGSRSGADAAAV